MKVIIFMMAYNAQATIKRTIESILNQTFCNWEYYILDNGSTDDTQDIIFEYSQKDERIIPIHVNKNDTRNGNAFFHVLTIATDANYIVWCDADDTYTLDFLENMVNFSETNCLDIAACGYDIVDGLTGKKIKHRALERHLVLQDSLFRDEFIQYRGFTLHLWGKLYSIPFLKQIQHDAGTTEVERIGSDSLLVLKLFKKATRAGIYGKAMYHHYRYPNSLSYTLIEEKSGIIGYHNLWIATKEYLESYGPISKLNEDFLHAIHLSFVDELTEKVFAAKLDTKKKLELLNMVFSDSVWVDTLKRKADPMFHNLAAREKFILHIKQSIAALPGIEAYQVQMEELFSYLNR